MCASQLVFCGRCVPHTQVLGSEVVTPEIADAWSESVLFLARVLIEREEQLYQVGKATERNARAVHACNNQGFPVACIA